MIRALLIQPEPLNKILAGTKIWEIRGSQTKIRKTIGLVPSRSGTVVAIAISSIALVPSASASFTPMQRKRACARIKPNSGIICRRTPGS